MKRPKPKRVHAKRKLTVLGVTHSTRDWLESGGSWRQKTTQNLKRLREQLKALKQKGITRIGIEKLRHAISPGERQNAIYRYFYGAQLIINRLGMKGVEVEDADAVRLQELLDRGGPPYFHKLMEMQAGVHYLRTFLMIQKARKLGLQAIVIGGIHAGHLRPSRYTIIQLDEPPVGGAYKDYAQETKKMFLKHKEEILKLYRQVKAGQQHP